MGSGTLSTAAKQPPHHGIDRPKLGNRVSGLRGRAAGRTYPGLDHVPLVDWRSRKVAGRRSTAPLRMNPAAVPDQLDPEPLRRRRRTKRASSAPAVRWRLKIWSGFGAAALRGVGRPSARPRYSPSRTPSAAIPGCSCASVRAGRGWEHERVGVSSAGAGCNQPRRLSRDRRASGRGRADPCRAAPPPRPVRPRRARFGSGTPGARRWPLWPAKPPTIEE